jgi:hypothetical protein
MSHEAIKAPAPSISRPIDTFGYFYGHELTFLDCEVIALSRIPSNLRKKEAELMRTRWFDYRRLHPTKATYLFAHAYNKAYQNCVAVMKDVGLRFMKGYKGADALDVHEKLSFWRARQLVDSLGIRYDFFLRKAMDWHIEAGWIQPPRPSHLASNPDMITDVMMAWEEECAARLQFPLDDRYKVRNWFGHIDQRDWEAWLVKQIMTRRHPQYGLHAALYIERVLRIETAIQSFERGVLEAVFDSA